MALPRLVPSNDDKPGVSSLETMSCRKQCPKDWASIWSCWWKVFCVSISLGICIMKSLTHKRRYRVQQAVQYRTYPSGSTCTMNLFATTALLSELHPGVYLTKSITVLVKLNTFELAWKIDTYMIWQKNNIYSNLMYTCDSPFSHGLLHDMNPRAA